MECDKNQTFLPPHPPLLNLFPPERFFILFESHWFCVQKNILPLKTRVAAVFSPVNKRVAEYRSSIRVAGSAFLSFPHPLMAHLGKKL